MHQRLNLLTRTVGAIALIAFAGGRSLGAESDTRSTSDPPIDVAAYQGKTRIAQLVPPPARNSTVPQPSPTNADPFSSTTTKPPAPQTTTSGPALEETLPSSAPSPLLDGKLPSEQLMTPVVQEGCNGDGEHTPVEPYGGGHPTDWTWGCGGSPYRTGPGLCDNWKVGCRWHVTADGIVLTREHTDLASLEAQMRINDPNGTRVADGNAGFIDLTPDREQFNHGPGGRFTFTSQVANCVGYDIQAVYEGINDWNSSVVFPIQALDVLPNGAGGNPFVITPSPNTEPPAPFPEGFQQRSLHYRSFLNSGELNWVRNCDPEWRPFCGFRYIRFDDEISDFLNQEGQIPLPGPSTTFVSNGAAPPVLTAVNDPIGPTEVTDRLNLFHLENNLMGFQIGLLHDTIHLNNRFAIEGFINGGVYYNRIKFSHVNGVFTTQTFADNTRTTGFDESRVDKSNAVINDSRELSEISYEAEASLTGVCRLNKCWALRAGYQVLWINHLHLADTAYLGDAESDQDLLFHGWHAGIECRR